MTKNIQKSVKNYYSKVLKTKDDLQTSACCPVGTMPSHLQQYLKNIHDTVHEKFYGCGAPIPPALEGLNVLDLGCGTGRDCYLLSQLVGETGTVTGIDMTKEQLDVAEEYVQYHTDKFGYKQPNVCFKEGYMEDLDDIGIESNSIDLVISNCVFNLSANKEKLFKEIFRALKPGGELYFSDVFTDRRLTDECKNDPVLLGECLGGALYIEDFRRLLDDSGCADYRTMSQTPIEISNSSVLEKTGDTKFNSITVRAFKLDLEDICEDYGQTATYNGTITNAPNSFILDDHHEFKTNEAIRVCGNTADMLSKTRYGPHFKIEGDMSTHYGPFDCTKNEKSKTLKPTSCC